LQKLGELNLSYLKILTITKTNAYEKKDHLINVHFAQNQYALQPYFFYWFIDFTRQTNIRPGKWTRYRKKYRPAAGRGKCQSKELKKWHHNQ
jgi:hypothetical protein